MAEKRDIDDVGGIELIKTMVEMFGMKRAAELTGWAVWWSMTGVKDVKALREDLQARGMSRASAFMAASDFRALKERLEQVEGKALSVPEVIQKLRAGDNTAN
jgi:hypothetical protein